MKILYVVVFLVGISLGSLVIALPTVKTYQSSTVANCLLEIEDSHRLMITCVLDEPYNGGSNMPLGPEYELNELPGTNKF